MGPYRSRRQKQALSLLTRVRWGLEARCPGSPVHPLVVQAWLQEAACSLLQQRGLALESTESADAEVARLVDELANALGLLDHEVNPYVRYEWTPPL
jgi:hypothetical protein